MMGDPMRYVEVDFLHSKKKPLHAMLLTVQSLAVLAEESIIVSSDGTCVMALLDDPHNDKELDEVINYVNIFRQRTLCGGYDE